MVSKRKTHEEYVQELKEIGIVVKEQYKNSHTAINHICPTCGKTDWSAIPYNILSKKSTMCDECGHNKLNTMTYSEKALALGIKVTAEFKDLNTEVNHTCQRCGKTDWAVKPNNILRCGTRMCIACSRGIQESIMATVIKQVLKHEYTDAIFELKFKPSIQTPLSKYYSQIIL